MHLGATIPTLSTRITANALCGHAISYLISSAVDLSERASLVAEAVEWSLGGNLENYPGRGGLVSHSVLASSSLFYSGGNPN